MKSSRTTSPSTRLAILAELKIADAHFKLEEYDEAIVAYEEFANLHPLNEAIPYVIYQTGLCYHNRVDTIDRDQNNALKALETFNRLTRQHPDDPYALKADEKAKECLKSIAGHEFLVGLYYFKSKHYKAALARFRSVLSQYPDVGVHQQAPAVHRTLRGGHKRRGDPGGLSAAAKKFFTSPGF